MMAATLASGRHRRCICDLPPSPNAERRTPIGGSLALRRSTESKVRQETVAQLGELDAQGRIAAQALAERSRLGVERQPGLFDDDLPTPSRSRSICAGSASNAVASLATSGCFAGFGRAVGLGDAARAAVAGRSRSMSPGGPWPPVIVIAQRLFAVEPVHRGWVPAPHRRPAGGSWRRSTTMLLPGARPGCWPTRPRWKPRI